jgi:hypothetical protein
MYFLKINQHLISEPYSGVKYQYTKLPIYATSKWNFSLPYNFFSSSFCIFVLAVLFFLFLSFHIPFFILIFKRQKNEKSSHPTLPSQRRCPFLNPLLGVPVGSSRIPCPLRDLRSSINNECYETYNLTAALYKHSQTRTYINKVYLNSSMFLSAVSCLPIL